LDYFRFTDVCEIILSGNVKKTDSNGFAKFDEFLVEKGPIGTYSFKFVSGDYYLESYQFNSFVTSDVA
jgi:5-hydroxyisourate hydrolase-like protein (transthyretin family)